MIISVASGKGGTGKTTIAVNLALSLNNVQFLDCDVEEPNSYLFIRPKIQEEKKAFILVPAIDTKKCNYCGKCREVCAYNALAVIPKTEHKNGSILLFPNLCHGCGACTKLCPSIAITEIEREIGIIEIGEKNGLEFVQGRLNIGEAMSPPLIRQVKNQIDPTKTVIIDAPPGTSCPVITSVRGSDYCILVTEPTPFGLNDLQLSVDVLRQMQISFGVIINRADLGTSDTEEYCQKENIDILMRLPFNKEIAIAYSQGIPLISEFPKYKEDFQNLFKTIKERIKL